MTPPSTPSLSIDSADLSWLGRLARALLRDPFEADDLVQETVLAALESRSGPENAKRPWLASVARRLAARRRRAEIRREDRERDHVHCTDELPVDELALAAESAELVVSVARGLPEPYRRTILEHFLVGLSIKEIASAAGERPDTARWRLRRGLELMRDALERRGGPADGPSGGWMMTLLPLATLPDGLRAAGASAGLTGLAPLALTSTALTMKGPLSVVALALCVLGWIVGQRLLAPDHSPELPGAAEPDVVASEGPPASESLGTMPEASEQLERVGASQSTAESADANPIRPWLEGRVVDSNGKGIEGAVVYLLDLDPELRGRDADGPRTESRRSGDFRFASKELRRWLRSKERTPALGAVANGFLRRTVTSLPLDEPGWVVVMQRGESVQGRVVDRNGRGVAGLNLLVHGDFRGANHVSPSRVLRRGGVMNLGEPASTYHQATSVSDRKGEVEFHGLGPGTYTVRSLDPNWEIVEGVECRAGVSGVRWVAHERFGVRVTATLRGKTVPELETSLRDQFGAEFGVTFRVELELDDGSVIDTGQWLGGGDGVATFSLMEDADPRVDASRVRAARFYGTARLGGEEKDWSAKRQARKQRKTRVAEATVDFDGLPKGALGDSEGPVRDATIEFDVRYLDSGSPFTGSLSVGWATRTSDGSQISDTERAVRLPGGRYRLSVPSGRVQLRVSDAQASGSIGSWEGEVDSQSGLTEDVFLELSQGAAATIVRPDDAVGEWFLRASYRAEGSDEWFGSWNYSTHEDSLRLTALKPAEWRLELRATRGDEEPLEVRIVTLAEGVDETVR